MARNFDTLITLLRPVSTVNAYNESIVVYSSDGDHWAVMDDLKSWETYKAAEVGQTLTTRFTVRWSPETAAADGTWHIRVDDAEYDIIAVREVGRRLYIEFDAAIRQGRDD